MGRFPFFFKLFCFSSVFVCHSKSEEPEEREKNVFPIRFCACRQSSLIIFDNANEAHILIASVQCAARTLLCIEIIWFITLLSRKVHTYYENGCNDDDGGGSTYGMEWAKYEFSHRNSVRIQITKVYAKLNETSERSSAHGVHTHRGSSDNSETRRTNERTN